MRERWETVQEILFCNTQSNFNPRNPKFVTFNTIATVMPLHQNAICVDKCSKCLICQTIFDVQLATFQLNPQNVEQGTYEFEEIWDTFKENAPRRSNSTVVPLETSTEMEALINAKEDLAKCLDMNRFVRDELKRQGLEAR